MDYIISSEEMNKYQTELRALKALCNALDTELSSTKEALKETTAALEKCKKTLATERSTMSTLLQKIHELDQQVIACNKLIAPTRITFNELV